MQESRPANESAPNVFMVSTIMPLAPPPLNGFIKAVGKPSTKRVSVPKARKNIFNAIDNIIKRSAGTQHAYRNQHPHQVRNDTYGRFKSAFCAFDKSIENIYLFINTSQYINKKI